MRGRIAIFTLLTACGDGLQTPEFESTSEFGDSSDSDTGLPTGDDGGELPEPELAPESRRVAAGASYSCALDQAGTASCWGGLIYFGQGGIPAPPGTFDWIIAGGGQACGGTPEGSVCTTLVGKDFVPMEIPAGQWAQIELALDHGCALDVWGMVTCWGVDEFGETEPPGDPMTKIGVWLDLSCGIRADDQLIECWGDYPPEYGDPPAGPQLDFSMNLGHNCALATDGEISCWGYKPPGVPEPGPFVDVEVGTYFGCGLREDGSVACWGDQFSPDVVPPGPFSAIEAGASHVCGITEAGDVQCWGYNGMGQTDVPG
jgi:hypothetical protein